MRLFHATTPAKLARYVATGAILPPVRGWAFINSARAWAKRTQRTVLLEIEPSITHPLPDHQPPGHAFWSPCVVREWTVREAPDA